MVCGRCGPHIELQLDEVGVGLALRGSQKILDQQANLLRRMRSTVGGEYSTYCFAMLQVI